MNLFRKYLSLLPLLCISFNSEAQQLGELDVHRGVNPFYLGSVRTQLDSSIRLVLTGKLEYNGRTEYNYAFQAKTDQPYNWGGVSFNTAVMTYVSDTLIRVMFNKLYLPRYFPDYHKRARSDYRKLCFMLTTQWKRAGSRKTFTQSPDKRITSRGFQWDTERARMKLALYEDKTKKQPLSDVLVTWELPGYD